MNMHFRIAHWLTVISFPALVITGFALKCPESWWARPMLIGEGRFAFRGTVHRIAAIVLLASVAYHVAHLVVRRRDRAYLREMLPNLDDMSNLAGALRYNLGFSGTRPVFGKFSYVEKIEYLAFLWGTAGDGRHRLHPLVQQFALRYFPKWVPDAATALHFYEAILATCAIVIWHMYTVVFDPDVYPMDRAWLDRQSLRRASPPHPPRLLRAVARARPTIAAEPKRRIRMCRIRISRSDERTRMCWRSRSATDSRNLTPAVKG